MKNLAGMMKQVQQMQTKAAEMQERLAEMEIEGQSGAGMVKIVLSGKGEARGASIDPSVIDADDKEMLEDLVVAAINDARGKLDAVMEEEQQKLMGGMKLPPGMKLPF